MRDGNNSLTDLDTSGPGLDGTMERYAHVIEASPAGLMKVSADGRIMLVNRHIETMFGYDRGELVGQPMEMLLPERFRGGHTALRRRFVAGASTRPMGAGRDIVGRRSDGSEFPVEIGLNPVMVNGVVRVVAAVQDITARRQEEEEKERQRQELERSNADLAEFAHAASHDLKAPLRGMAHLADWIAEDVADIASPQTLENCALLRRRAERMQRLLDGLLAYARAGRTSVTAETVDCAEMIRELVATLALPAGFTVELAGEMPVFRTLRLPLERVLQNLIENAVKHHDRPSGTVTVTANRKDGIVHFSVADDGPGIPPRYHQKIFQIFQTLASRDDVEASGIGLAIVKRKVEMNGGVITVESAPPVRGARFVFTWPETAPA